nr:hypothetical protein [Pseudaminobacter salicylatoxidans]
MLGLLTWSHVEAYRAGQIAAQTDILTRINQENEHAGNEAERWRSEYRRCNDAGGVYDFAAGACDR